MTVIIVKVILLFAGFEIEILPLSETSFPPVCFSSVFTDRRVFTTRRYNEGRADRTPSVGLPTWPPWPRARGAKNDLRKSGRITRGTRRRESAKNARPPAKRRCRRGQCYSKTRFRWTAVVYARRTTCSGCVLVSLSFWCPFWCDSTVSVSGIKVTTIIVRVRIVFAYRRAGFTVKSSSEKFS